ncbi:hypothetical protein [Flavobacterium pectinovorum]|uniref:Ig-like domain-containing protein n=1 Tax=Flavobacterium pectinovorum TaxID=29533 RepID=A0A502EH37_9FLAO|nr:hypothetical protein [Flavobacterium pectinovorum]TPG36332.1 hypothetical protein EAH81_19870 [Flavobacterium pectinovorum]
MKKTLLFLLPIVCSISLFSCSTNEAITCYLPANVASSNSPLVPGGTLLLNADSAYSSDVSYNWSGPNNFHSNLQNPIINSVTPSMTGEYKLKTNKGICESSESIVVVDINAPNIPCNPVKNTMIFEKAGLGPLTFGSVYSSHVNDDYYITAGSLEATLKIEFASNVIPIPGIYSICSSCPTSFMKSSEVCVSLNYVTFSHANSGLVYVSLVNGKLTATFCNVIFDQSPFTLNSSATITEN